MKLLNTVNPKICVNRLLIFHKIRYLQFTQDVTKLLLFFALRLFLGKLWVPDNVWTSDYNWSKKGP